MNNPIQRRSEMQELKREIPFWSAPDEQANGGTDIPIEDPDRMLGMTVLLLACLALAALAHAFVS